MKASENRAVFNLFLWSGDLISTGIADTPLEAEAKNGFISKIDLQNNWTMINLYSWWEIAMLSQKHCVLDGVKSNPDAFLVKYAFFVIYLGWRSLEKCLTLWDWTQIACQFLSTQLLLCHFVIFAWSDSTHGYLSAPCFHFTWHQ